MSQRYEDRQNIATIQAPVLKLEQFLRQSGFDMSLLHLIKFRASQINGCAYCLAMHSRDARLEGEREDRLHVISAWRETDWFSPREQAALAFTEAVTTLENQHVPDEVFAQAREQFSEQELATLTLAIATINVWNRICITWGIPPEAFTVPAEQPVAASV
jgi:AhpD family alkylhydroperoxidase